MKQILKKRNGKFIPVYAWAVDYSKRKAKARKLVQRKPHEKVG